MISARSRLDAAASLVGEFGEVWVREVGHDDAERVRGAGLEGSGDGVGVVVEPLRHVETGGALPLRMRRLECVTLCGVRHCVRPCSVTHIV